MLWALVSSAYIIYLYRKLRGEQEPQTVPVGTRQSGAIGAELDKLNERLASLEARVSGLTGQKETVR